MNLHVLGLLVGAVIVEVSVGLGRLLLPGSQRGPESRFCRGLGALVRTALVGLPPAARKGSESRGSVTAF